ncbi:nucleotidyltransferase family protein [candidate division KSB1 bacterium]|nr:nucleotidyltransferase family protein [candidate division KSB1 bacterium]
MFSAEDTVLHLAVHQCYSHVARITLKRIYNFAAFIHEHSEQIDWECIVERSQHYRIATPVMTALRLCEQLYSIHAQRYVIEQLLPAYSGQQMEMLTYFSEHNSSKSSGYLFLIPGFMNEVSYLLARVFPPRNF